MKMGEDTLRATKAMFKVRTPSRTWLVSDINTLQTDVESKISISLDAWTSSNNFAFMAIIAHYITNAGRLGKSSFVCIWVALLRYARLTEELLIDFRELEGEHSGANLAAATWDTLTSLGIEDRVSHPSTSLSTLC